MGRLILAVLMALILVISSYSRVPDDDPSRANQAGQGGVIAPEPAAPNPPVPQAAQTEAQIAPAAPKQGSEIPPDENSRRLYGLRLSAKSAFASGAISEASLLCANEADLQSLASCRMKSLLLSVKSGGSRASMMAPECFALSGGNRAECISRQSILEKCLKPDSDGERFSCARNSLGIPDGAGAYKAACAKSFGSATHNYAACASDAKDALSEEANFRFSSLELKAASLIAFGAEESDVLAFAKELEDARESFMASDSAAGKKAALRLAGESYNSLYSRSVRLHAGANGG